LMRAWMYRLMPFLSRWSNAAPATCCGVCRSCYTTTATNLAAVGAGLALEAVGIRSELRRESDRESPAEGAVELPMARQA
jgi:hypothetical protein